MGADSDAVEADGFENELSIFRRQVVEALLDDVIAVQILDQWDDLVSQSFDNDLNLGKC